MPTLPISPVKLPSTLIGQTNGKLNPSVLTTFFLDDNDPVVTEITAARAFRALFAAARKDIPGLRVRDVGGYRTYQQQVDLFKSRMAPVSYATYLDTPSSHRRIWRDSHLYGYSSIYFKRVSGAACATPGTSNHGWALAIDVAENVDMDSAPEAITSEFVNWLIVNAYRFGISAELQSEPWHWRYVAGDNLPAAVLAYEQGTNPPTFVIVKDEDMIYMTEMDRRHDSRPGNKQTTNTPQKKLKPGDKREIDLGMATVHGVRVTVINAKGWGYVSITGTPGLAEPTVNMWDGKSGDGTTFVATPEGLGYISTTVECDVIVDVFARG